MSRRSPLCSMTLQDWTTSSKFCNDPKSPCHFDAYQEHGLFHPFCLVKAAIHVLTLDMT
ncbi:hypothetical protein M758_12G145300 [Ceratodon purpureus]|uniref:Uncharacterized protein n=1 Tax=Ceratodon purpureus TaxID=3225 RepID=A0A8T0G6Z9_CERPU|nr:hypothetical protein KC19_12G141800 [Ceratodon purpureus]KAG0599344.1 hypothetical protein M758_12G145300 [Ceratodon purpureus]